MSFSSRPSQCSLSTSTPGTSLVERTKRKCRSNIELQQSPSYSERSSKKLTQDTKCNINSASILYVDDICVEKPWLAAEPKAGLINECLNQANIRSSADGLETTDESSSVTSTVCYTIFSNAPDLIMAPRLAVQALISTAN